jgi:hypothetical protein
VHFFDAGGLSGKNLAEIDFLPSAQLSPNRGDDSGNMHFSRLGGTTWKLVYTRGPGKLNPGYACGQSIFPLFRTFYLRFL